MQPRKSRPSRRWLLVTGTLLTAACGASDPKSDPSVCENGALIEADSRAFCVFSGAAPLVIEGGFECPPRFEFMLEVGKSIVCGDRAIERARLPDDVCQEIGDDCDLVHAAPELIEDGGVGECIYPCNTASDCPAEEFVSPGGVDCVDNVCVATGCVDDAQCSSVIDAPTVCRQDALATVPLCIAACQTRADCVAGYSDPDNAQIDCVNGGCEFVGCTTEEECPGLAECLPTAHGIRECVYRCDTPEDCGAAFSAETPMTDQESYRITGVFRTAAAWTCRENVCEYKPHEVCRSADDCFGRDNGARCRFPM